MHILSGVERSLNSYLDSYLDWKIFRFNQGEKNLEIKSWLIAKKKQKKTKLN